MWYLLFLVPLFLLASTAHIRHKKINGQFFQAWFIEFPGWDTCYYPEITVSAENWLGSRINGLDITTNGEKNPEIESLLIIKALGMFPSECQIEECNGQYVLHRASRQEKYFSLCAFYRISFWKPSFKSH